MSTRTPEDDAVVTPRVDFLLLAALTLVVSSAGGVLLLV
jgi:hypothetical protein